MIVILHPLMKLGSPTETADKGARLGIDYPFSAIESLETSIQTSSITGSMASKPAIPAGLKIENWIDISICACPNALLSFSYSSILKYY